MYVWAVLKQKIRAGGIKNKRYDERFQKFKQNQLFRTNQKLFYGRQMKTKKKSWNRATWTQWSYTTFWGRIWWEEVSHHEKASWLADIEQEISTTETQKVIIITVGDIINGVKNMANCKAAGAGLVQDCLFKKLTPTHIRWQEYQQDCVCQGNIPEWIVTGRTVLIQNDPAKGNHASNYRPEACLPMMWKLLTGIMGEQLY